MTSVAKNFTCSKKRGKQASIRALWECDGYRIYNGKVSAHNKSCGGNHVFRNSSVPIHNPSPCRFSPAAREPISVAMSFYLLRKRGAIMQKANVDHGKTKMDKTVRGRELPWVRR
jgi:hypothetical protein